MVSPRALYDVKVCSKESWVRFNWCLFGMRFGMLICVSRKKGSYAITVGIRSGRFALIRMKAILFLKGDSSLVTFELDSSVATCGALEAPSPGMCALRSESQTITTIVKNVEMAVVMLRFQC